MSFDTNVKAELLKNKAARDAKNATAAPVVEPQRSQNIDNQATTVNQPSQPQPSAQPAVPVQPPAAQAVPQPQGAVQPPAEPATPQQTSAEPTVKTDKPATQLDLVEPTFEWDQQTSASPVEPTKPVTPDFKKIGSALKLEVEVTSEEELVTKVNERITQLSSVFDGVPEPLKQAVELAKKGGDWLAFTGAAALDVSKLDPIQVFEKQYIRENAHRWKKPDGTFDLAARDAELDGIQDGVKIMNGNFLIQQITAQQDQRQRQIIEQTAKKQEAFQKTLGEATRELPTLLPQDTFGVAIEPDKSAFFYKGISDGSLIRKHIGNIDLGTLTQLDAKKLVKTIAMAELGEKISKFRYEKGVVAGKKEILNLTQNAQITTRTSPPKPDDPTPPAQPTSTDKLKAYHTSKKPANSL